MKIREWPLLVGSFVVAVLLAPTPAKPAVPLARKVAYAKQHVGRLELFLRRSMPLRAVMRIQWLWEDATARPDGVAVPGFVNKDPAQTFTLRVWSNDTQYRRVHHSGGAELIAGAPLFAQFAPQKDAHDHVKYGYWYK